MNKSPFGQSQAVKTDAIKTSSFYGILRGTMIALLAVSTVCLSGCGYDTYQARERETVNHYKYLQKLNTNLQEQPMTGAGTSQINCRIPKNFKLMPRKQDETKDNRQPDYLGNYELPGLVAAWKMQVTVDGRASNVYLYALSNYDLWVGMQRKKAEENLDNPEEFLVDLENGLQAALEVTKDEEFDRSAFVIPTTVAEKEYAKEKSFELLTYLPPRKLLQTASKVQLYKFEKGKVQAALLLVTPANYDQQGTLGTGMTYALHTFDAFKPTNTGSIQKTGQTGGGGGAPGF